MPIRRKVAGAHSEKRSGGALAFLSFFQNGGAKPCQLGSKSPKGTSQPFLFLPDIYPDLFLLTLLCCCSSQQKRARQQRRDDGRVKKIDITPSQAAGKKNFVSHSLGEARIFYPCLQTYILYDYKKVELRNQGYFLLSCLALSETIWSAIQDENSGKEEEASYQQKSLKVSGVVCGTHISTAVCCNPSCSNQVV